MQVLLCIAMRTKCIMARTLRSMCMTRCCHKCATLCTTIGVQSPDSLHSRLSSRGNLHTLERTNGALYEKFD